MPWIEKSNSSARIGGDLGMEGYDRDCEPIEYDGKGVPSQTESQDNPVLLREKEYDIQSLLEAAAHSGM